MQRARQTLDQADATLNTIKQMLEPQSPLRYELDQTLEQVSGAGRSIRVLTDYLERNPQALLFGKPGPTDGTATASPGDGKGTPVAVPRAGR
jgi:paraquat-inducible protein B